MKPITLLIALALACTTHSSEPMLPDLGDGKTDFAGSTIDRGDLEFDTEATGEFVDDFEYHLFRIDAEAGAELTLDVTQAGTSRDLATVLVMYGPPDAEGTRERLAHDFDSGWGKHSRIRGFVAETRGEYVALLGTADGLERGNYRLTLSCDNDACHAAIGEIALQENDPNTEFLETMGMVPEEVEEYCWGGGRAYTYPDEMGEVSTNQAAAAIARQFNEENELYDDDEVFDGGEVSHAGFNRWLGDTYGYTTSTWDNAVGYFDDEYEINRIDFDWECAASVNCSGTVMVVHYPQLREVWTVEFGCGDE